MKLMITLLSLAIAVGACKKDDETKEVRVISGGGSGGGSGSGSGSGGGQSEAGEYQSGQAQGDGEEVSSDLSYQELNNLKFAHLEVFDGPQIQRSFVLEKDGEFKELAYPDFAGNSALNACSLDRRIKNGQSTYSLSFSLGDEYKTGMSADLNANDYLLIQEFTSLDEFLAEDYLDISHLTFDLSLQEPGEYFYLEEIKCAANIRPVALDFFHYNDYQTHSYTKGFAIEFQCENIDKPLKTGVNLSSMAVTYYCSIAETDYTY